MKKKIKYTTKSKCCKAEIITIASQDFVGDDILEEGYVGTCYFECSQCGKPCDIIQRRIK
jgi:hypothetical protein